MRTVPTGRTPHEVVEVGQPERCANGHDLAGPRSALYGYGPHPRGGRARVITCRTCGAEWWDRPSDAAGET